jgi:hypothetical protein
VRLGELPDRSELGSSLLICYNTKDNRPRTMHGIRIGTPYQDVSLSYCSDDNTYTEHPITRQGVACPLEWAPIRRPEPTTDLWAELFGEG